MGRISLAVAGISSGAAARFRTGVSEADAVDFQKILCSPANPLLGTAPVRSARWVKIFAGLGWESGRARRSDLESGQAGGEKLRTPALETVPGKVDKLASRSLRGSTLSASKLRGGGNNKEGVFLPPLRGILGTWTTPDPLNPRYSIRFFRTPLAFDYQLVKTMGFVVISEPRRTWSRDRV